MLTVEEAQKIIETFTCLDMRIMPSNLEREQLRKALLLLANSSDYQMLGICASSIEEGFLALEAYLKALGYEANLDYTTKSVDGSVYIKFNTLKGSYYVDSYNGTFRGVLVSCQSSIEGGINGTYGHLPLDLFANC
ncbi:hypothetical protein BCD67_25490 [Oscillatoriales cyanobacterium USR001]|nr:hypothetical protein BCD67_25490 [Oscillatoriales cyanobacterium USR001]